MNQQLSDIATNGLTDCLTKTGQSTMTGQLKAIGGNATSPSYTFGGNLNDGMYLAGPHQLGFTTNGIQALTINSDQSVTFANTTGVIGQLATNATFQYIIDGGGNPITAGIKGWLEIPFNATIKRATLLADQTGSIVVDILTSTYAAYNPGVSFTSICGGNSPAIVAALSSQNTTLIGWTTALTSGNIIEFNVTGLATNITRVTLSLYVLRTGA